MQDVNFSVWGVETNFWGRLNRLMGGNKSTAHGSVGDDVVARLRGQALQPRTIQMNFKQLLMQGKLVLIGSKESQALRRFIKINNVAGDKAWRREGNRLDLWIQRAQLPTKPARLLGLVQEPRAV